MMDLAEQLVISAAMEVCGSKEVCYLLVKAETENSDFEVQRDEW